MKRLRFLILSFGLAMFTGSGAAPFTAHQACGDQTFDPMPYSATQLREIAFTCDSPAAVRLFLNRARYVELIDKWGHLAYIDGTGESGQRIRALKLYVALIESFSRKMPDSDSLWMVRLNEGYRDATRLRENVLRGFSSSLSN